MTTSILPESRIVRYSTPDYLDARGSRDLGILLWIAAVMLSPHGFPEGDLVLEADVGYYVLLGVF